MLTETFRCEGIYSDAAGHLLGIKRLDIRIGRVGYDMPAFSYADFVAAAAAGYGIVSQAADEHIVSVTAAQLIVSAAAEDDVVTGAAFHGVIAVAGIDKVIAGAALDHVIAGAAVNDVVAGAALEGIAALTAVYIIASGTAGNFIVSLIAEQFVFAAAAHADRVIAFAAADVIVAGTARDCIAAASSQYIQRHVHIFRCRDGIVAGTALDHQMPGLLRGKRAHFAVDADVHRTVLKLIDIDAVRSVRALNPNRSLRQRPFKALLNILAQHFQPGHSLTVNFLNLVFDRLQKLACRGEVQNHAQGVFELRKGEPDFISRTHGRSGKVLREHTHTGRTAYIRGVADIHAVIPRCKTTRFFSGSDFSNPGFSGCSFSGCSFSGSDFPGQIGRSRGGRRIGGYGRP